MKELKLLSLGLAVIFAVCSCNRGNDGTAGDEAARMELKKEIAELKKSLTDDQKGINKAVAEQIIEKYGDYADRYINDKETPEYLFQAANVLIGLNRFSEAVTYLYRIHVHYAQYDKAPECLYLIGFIYDHHLNRKGRAREVYTEVIETYPKLKIAEDARAAIDLLLMSEDDLIKMLREKEQQNDSIN